MTKPTSGGRPGVWPGCCEYVNPPVDLNHVSSATVAE
jgi:hypothetical protein